MTLTSTLMIVCLLISNVGWQRSQSNWRARLDQAGEFRQTLKAKAEQKEPDRIVVDPDLDSESSNDETTVYLLLSAVIAFCVGYRVFRNQSPHHEFGSTVAAFSAPIVLVTLFVYGFPFNGNSICHALSAACFGYLLGAALSVIWSIPIRKLFLRRKRKKRDTGTRSGSELLDDIQTDLLKQLKAIDGCDVDEETKNDLQEAARQAAVERMARILEATDDQNSQ